MVCERISKETGLSFYPAENKFAALAAHDAYHYLGARNQLVKVPPTGTNLGDIAIFLAAGS